MWLYALFATTLIAAQQVILTPGDTYPSATLGAVYSFQIVAPFPVNGMIMFDGVELPSPYVFTTMTLLTYQPSDLLAFQTLDLDPYAPFSDSFVVEYTIVEGEITTVSNFSVGVSIVDAYIRTTPDIILHARTNETVVFDILVGTEKDRHGSVDGLVSRYAFREPVNQTIYEGLKFTNTDWLYDSACTSFLSVNASYPATTFCVMYTGTEISYVQRFPYVAAGRLVDDASIGTITLASFGFSSPCNGACNVSIAEGTPNATAFDVYYASGDGVAQFTLYVSQFPEGVDVYLDGLPVTSDTVDMGIVPGNLSFIPRDRFFTEYRYLNENGVVSTNYSDGTPISDCIDNICASKLNFYVEAAGVVFPSVSVYISVYRVIVNDTITVCSSCSVQGTSPGGFAFVLEGASDGREIPDFIITVISLPKNGTLYNSNTTVNIGDQIFARTLDLYYDPNPGYFNRFFYLTAPSVTLSVTDDLGGTAPDPTPDTFVFSIQSAYSAFSTPVLQGTVNILVSSSDGTRLTACPANATEANFWQVPCVAVGMESNTVYGEYPTPLYLDSDGIDEEESRIYRITRLPAHGSLYKNTGTHTEPVPGDRVNLLAALDSPSILYVGFTNYCNQREGSFANLIGEPMGGCSSVSDDLGCPDTFTFKVETTVTNRTSPPVTYYVYIVALASESVLSSPESLMVPGGGTALLPVTYTDPDDGESYVLIEIVSYDAVYGSPSGSSGMFALPPCFAIMNCTEQMHVYVLDKHASLLVEQVYVTVEENYTAEDERTVYVSVIKRPEGGFLTTDMYVATPGDLVFATDVVVYADPDDDDPYYFDGCAEDDCEEFFSSQNAIAIAEQIMAYIALAVGVIGPLIAIGNIVLIWWLFCSKGRNIVKQVQSIAEITEKTGFLERNKQRERKSGSRRSSSNSVSWATLQEQQ